LLLLLLAPAVAVPLLIAVEYEIHEVADLRIKKIRNQKKHNQQQKMFDRPLKVGSKSKKSVLKVKSSKFFSFP